MNKKLLSHLDYWLIGAVILLSIFGIICIGSATHINLGEDPSTYYSQILWFLTGIPLLIIACIINYKAWSKYYLFFYVFLLLLLVAVVLLGRTANNAKRWLYLGPIGIQPSEFAKIILIFALAKLIDRLHDRINQLPVLVFLCAFILLPVALIQQQPSLSASLVLCAILLIELFVAGISKKYILICLVVALPLVLLVCLDAAREDPLLVDHILAPHQLSRIRTFLRPVEGSNEYYQTFKSINAIGSGGLTGKGLYQGTLNQLSYLPEPHNDFIFSVIGEEFGFVGCVTILALEYVVAFRCFLTAMNCRDLFSQLIAAGIGGMFAFQTFVNTGVAVNLLPNTGMSLPFVSYGGSSMWTNMVAIGLVLNIGANRAKSIFEEV